MFQITQKCISLLQLSHFLRSKQILLGQDVESAAGRAVAQVGVAAAANELEYLGQEFDFPDAAASELDVVTAVGMPGFLPRNLGADLRMHVAHRFDGAEIQIAPVNEGPDDLLQRGDVVRAASDSTCLDPGIAFPFAALDDQVFLDHAEAGRKRSRSAVRPQRHVDTECKAVFGDFRQGADQLLAENGEKFMVGQRSLAGRRSLRFTMLRIDEDQVDIGRNIQFAAAQLTHAQHDHFLRRSGFFSGRRAMNRGQFHRQRGEVGPDGEIGEGADRFQHLGELGAAAEIALDQGSDDEVADAAHGARQRITGRCFVL
jgi:hypothetical protein